MRWIVFALGGVLSIGSAAAEPADVCEAPEYLVHTEGRLNRVAAAVANEHRLPILVVGTGSSVLTGPDGLRNAYPARLEAALAARLPGTNVTVQTNVQSRRTAADMLNALEAVVLESKPKLVIWQTGTVDAMRGVDPDEFRTTLEDGIKKLHAAGADVILVNMQYSPRTESMIAAGTYADNMHLVAQQHDIPLFDRLGIMRHWSENGVFDFAAHPADSRMAARVHDCIGKLMAELIIEQAHLNKKSVDHK